MTTFLLPLTSCKFWLILSVILNNSLFTSPLPIEKSTTQKYETKLSLINSSKNRKEQNFESLNIVNSASNSHKKPEHILMLKEKLRQVFQLDDAILWRKEPEHRNNAPEYMVDLYKQTADIESGITKTGKPYNATLIRSFNNKGLENENHFWFNLTKLQSAEDLDKGTKPNMSLKGAEFHIFKHVKKTAENNRTHGKEQKFIELRLFSISFKSGAQNATLVESRLVSSRGSGWEVFHVLDIVNYWTQNPHDNFGFYISLKGLDGAEIAADSVQMEVVSQSKSRHRPLLVVFCQEGTTKKELTEFKSQESLMNSVPEKKDFISRQRRSEETTQTSSGDVTSNIASGITHPTEPKMTHNRMMNDQQQQPIWSQRRNCERLPLYVDFYEIGWSGWIISPSGYNAYYCQGECPFPLGQMHRPSNHATVQSIVNAIGPKLESGGRIPQPCCVPDKLYSISLLYFDDSGDVILKQYDDMVAASCGCH